jgi:hypothetical protein
MLFLNMVCLTVASPGGDDISVEFLSKGEALVKVIGKVNSGCLDSGEACGG